MVFSENDYVMLKISDNNVDIGVNVKIVDIEIIGYVELVSFLKWNWRDIIDYLDIIL